MEDTKSMPSQNLLLLVARVPDPELRDLILRELLGMGERPYEHRVRVPRRTLRRWQPQPIEVPPCVCCYAAFEPAAWAGGIGGVGTIHTSTSVTVDGRVLGDVVVEAMGE